MCGYISFINSSKTLTISLVKGKQHGSFLRVYDLLQVLSTLSCESDTPGVQVHNNPGKLKVIRQSKVNLWAWHVKPTLYVTFIAFCSSLFPEASALVCEWENPALTAALNPKAPPPLYPRYKSFNVSLIRGSCKYTYAPASTSVCAKELWAIELCTLDWVS